MTRDSQAELAAAFDELHRTLAILSQQFSRLEQVWKIPRCVECDAPAVETVLQAPRCEHHASEVARRVDFDAMRAGK